MSKKRIFIGGTGRSGTTILSKFLGSHLEVNRIPFESRFVTDHGGLVSLFTSLTGNYSVDQSRVAIREFEKMMVNDLVKSDHTPYLGHPARSYKDQITLQTKWLIEKLSEGTFKGKNFQSIDKFNFTPALRKLLKPINYFLVRGSNFVFGKKLQLGLYGYEGVIPYENMYIPKYFSDEKKLSLIIGDYIDEIFGSFLKDKDSSWCEDTPANIYHIDILSKIFPDAYFLHVMRHPVGVAYSMLRMPWAPNNLKQVCDLLSNLYEKGIVSHQFGIENQNINYLFIKLEELAEPINHKQITDFIDLDADKFSGIISIDLNRMNYFLKTIDHEDLNYIQNRLSKYISFFGYESLHK